MRGILQNSLGELKLLKNQNSDSGFNISINKDLELSLKNLDTIRKKKTLKEFYSRIYNFFKSESSIHKKCVEIGSGGGFIKEIIPYVITSDILPIYGLDMKISAENLTFEDESVYRIFMINVLHHIPNVENFFYEAQRCLENKGKIIMFEPANTIWSRFIYKYFHHEIFDEKASWKFESIGPLISANGALPWILFFRDKSIFQKKFPNLNINKIKCCYPFSYIATGGLSKPSLMPQKMFFLIRIIELLLSPFSKFLGMFYIIEVQKNNGSIIKMNDASNVFERENETVTFPSRPGNTFISKHLNNIISAEVSAISKYFDNIFFLKSNSINSKSLIDKIKCKNKIVLKDMNEFKSSFSEYKNDYNFILMNGTINYHSDVYKLLQNLKPSLDRTARLGIIGYNPYLKILVKIAKFLSIKDKLFSETFFTEVDLLNIVKSCEYEVTKTKNIAYFPWKLFGIGEIFNKVIGLIPFINRFSLIYFLVLRPVVKCNQDLLPSLSIIVPARNEFGNLDILIKKIPKFHTKFEILFIEGNSTDNTYIEMLRIKEANKDLNIRVFKQEQKGKADAVRFGISKSNYEIIVILDADISVEPEYLTRFYDIYCSGYADFVNGSRLVYPMQKDAMRTLNRIGNVFFAKNLSYLLDVKLGDTLCGTKLFSRKDYERFVQWRKLFGDFDPFGDFELIFPAAILGLGIIDVPVPYKARIYGKTNINRFRDGYVLLKMTFIAFFYVKINLFNKD
jgi:SAM-dependent methyltransferase